jgi:hypothetical protein
MKKAASARPLAVLRRFGTFCWYGPVLGGPGRPQANPVAATFELPLGKRSLKHVGQAVHGCWNDHPKVNA